MLATLLSIVGLFVWAMVLFTSGSDVLIALTPLGFTLSSPQAVKRWSKAGE